MTTALRKTDLPTRPKDRHRRDVSGGPPDSDSEAEKSHVGGGTLFVVLCAASFIVIALCAAYIVLTWNG